MINAIGGDLPGATTEGAAGWAAATAAHVLRAAGAVGAPILNLCHYRFEV